MAGWGGSAGMPSVGSMTFSPTDRRPRVSDAAVYVLTGFPLAVAAFVLMVVGFSVAAGTLVILVGVAVLALTLLTAQGFAGTERARLDLLLRRRVPRPAYRPLKPGALGGAVSAGADPRRWLDLLHGVVGFPVAVAAFAVTVGWFAAAGGGLSYVLWQWSLPDEHEGLSWLFGFGTGDAADILTTTLAGAAAAVTLPWVVRGCAAVQSGLAWVLLCAGDPEPARRSPEEDDVLLGV